MPDERRVLQTKQKKKTCNPFFDETFIYQVRVLCFFYDFLQRVDDDTHVLAYQK